MKQLRIHSIRKPRLV